MRVATFNVENLFSRARALNADTQKNKQVMEDATRLQELIGEETYSPQDNAGQRRDRQDCSAQSERAGRVAPNSQEGKEAIMSLVNGVAKHYFLRFWMRQGIDLHPSKADS